MPQNYLVIVESPAKARTIEHFLGKDYKVMASMGHIRDLPGSKMGIDTKKKFAPSYVISPDKKKIVSELKKSADKAKHILIATDEDREGEAIGWHLLHILGLKDSEYQRIVFHEITKKAIEEAIKNPRKIDTNLVNAQQARRILDRLVGYELSPLLWAKIKTGLSAGRVQSVALRLIVEREEEIKAFKPEEFWKIIASLAKWDMLCDEIIDAKGKAREIKNQKEADKILEESKGKDLIISNIDSKISERTPPPPFITSTLQQAASTELGYGVKHTMSIAQKLYEGVDMAGSRGGLITYMRTDSFNLSSQALSQARKVIEKEYGKEYALTSPRTYATKSKGAQEAHEAIRPVDFENTPDSVKQHLSPQEHRLYELIYNRALQTQMEKAKVAVTNLEANPEGTEYIFKAKGEEIIFDGWLRLGKPKKEIIFPKLKEGERLKVEKYTGEQNFTKPPARYTEASLVKEMEKLGIGRPSTYAPTIETLMDRGYTVKEDPDTKERTKNIYPTEIGIVVTAFLKEHFTDVMNYDFTAEMETNLDKIADGDKVWQKVLGDFYTPFHKLIEDKKKNLVRQVEFTKDICPECGKKIVIKLGRFGKFLTCEDYPTCKYKAPNKEEAAELKELNSEYKDEKCEKCGKPMAVKIGRFGKFLACSDYPACKTTKAIVKSSGVKCPECGNGELIEKRTKRGKTFWGCSTYPKCKHASWTNPAKPKVEKKTEEVEGSTD